jgi:CheY-like chemotaxis protein
MNGYRILVIGEDAGVDDALCRLLSHRAWVVTVATTVAEAMDSLHPPPHCILLDLMLPDGVEAVRADSVETPLAPAAAGGGMNGPVHLAMVKDMNVDALFRRQIDFDEVCRLVDDETWH